MVQISVNFTLPLKKKKRFWNIELNRDIGVIVFKNTSWPELEKIKKLKKKHKNYSKSILDFIAECNMKILNYLNFILNLDDGTYKPNEKLNNTKYIHVDSDHP